MRILNDGHAFYDDAKIADTVLESGNYAVTIDGIKFVISKDLKKCDLDIISSPLNATCAAGNIIDIISAKNGVITGNVNGIAVNSIGIFKFKYELVQKGGTFNCATTIPAAPSNTIAVSLDNTTPIIPDNRTLTMIPHAVKYHTTVVCIGKDNLKFELKIDSVTSANIEGATEIKDGSVTLVPSTSNPSLVNF